MYLKKIICENMGPISGVDIDLGFNGDGTPKPIVLVGKNGTGKSILISNIVDALIEFGTQAYDDIAIKIPLGHSYFKTVASNQIQFGKGSMVCFLGFVGKAEKDGKHVFPEYCYHMEKESLFSSREAQLKNQLKSSDFKLITFKKEEEKSVSPHKDFFESEFASKSFIFFPPDRFTIPYWMSGAYSSKHDYGQIVSQVKVRKQLKKPIIVLDPTDENTRWLVDVIVDSKLETPVGSAIENGFHLLSGDVLASVFIDPDTQALNIAKKNVERVASEILEKKLTLNIGNRSLGWHRLRFFDDAGTPIAPTFDALSTGQCVLLNMFLTIIRYADKIDLNKSIRLHDIAGIVVIDEIELHLHLDLQQSTLPKLIKLFPRVQFVITTHSPLFLLGMEKAFGTSGFDIYEMPSATKICAEEFSEFGKAYETMSETNAFRMKIRESVDKYSSRSDKILIVTEGATDWKHMKRAWSKLSHKEEYLSIVDKFEFLEYEPQNSQKNAELKLKMSDSELLTVCESYAKLPLQRTIVFIADADNPQKTKKLIEDGKCFKKWNSNVYSFQIPVPTHRCSTPEVCIEHYYTDEEIKTEKEINGVCRRLFLGNEFDDFGISLDKKYLFAGNKKKCGRESISVIDGTEDARVIEIQSDCPQNLALPKMNFAESILNEEGDFANISSERFHLIFDILKKIINGESP